MRRPNISLLRYAITIIVPAILLSACQSMYVPQARDIKRKPRTGGVIGIPTNSRPEDRQKADSLMQQNCNGLKVEVADEGEVVVGQETKTQGSETNRDDSRKKEGSFLGLDFISGANAGKETSQSATTTQLKEWQISYNCIEQSPTKKK